MRSLALMTRVPWKRIDRQEKTWTAIDVGEVMRSSTSITARRWRSKRAPSSSTPLGHASALTRRAHAGAPRTRTAAASPRIWSSSLTWPCPITGPCRGPQRGAVRLREPEKGHGFPCDFQSTAYHRAMVHDGPWPCGFWGLRSETVFAARAVGCDSRSVAPSRARSPRSHGRNGARSLHPSPTCRQHIASLRGTIA